MIGGRRFRVAAVSVAVVCALPLLSGCDGYVEVEATNGCTGPIEVKDAAAPVDVASTEVAPGERASVEGEHGELDVVVRAPGSSADPIHIDWEDMDVRGEQAGRDVTVEGSTCPGQQS